MTTADHDVTRWQSGETLPYEERRARNTSAVSENKIHEDDVARQFGFRGGLVPGATSYAYLASYLTRTLGPEWAASGSATITLARPVYEGDTVRIGGTVVEARGDRERGSLSLECWVDGPDGTRCAPGTAALSWPAERVPFELPAFARTEQEPRRSEERAPISAASAPLNTPLPPVIWPADAAAAGDYLDGIEERDPLFRERSPFGPPLMHPGLYPNIANRVLSANFRLGPWIHTRSEIQHLAPALPGGAYRAYGQLIAAFEKRGHEYVTADVVIADGANNPVARLQHTAIVVVGKQDG